MKFIVIRYVNATAGRIGQATVIDQPPDRQSLEVSEVSQSNFLARIEVGNIHADWFKDILNIAICMAVKQDDTVTVNTDRQTRLYIIMGSTQRRPLPPAVPRPLQ